MKRSQILEKIKSYINNFSDWDEESFKALHELTRSDIDSKTRNYYLAIPLLERIFLYDQIKMTIDKDELGELKELCCDKTIMILENVLRIIDSSSSYIDQLEIDEIDHPVCIFYKYKSLMFQAEDSYFESLGIYKDEVENVIVEEINNFLYERDKQSIYFYQSKFENEVKPIVFSSLNTRNIEKILVSLTEYSNIKLSAENGLNCNINYLKSSIMMTLYNYNQMNQDIELNELYQGIEHDYLSNKYYLNGYRNVEIELNKCKEMCKKL